MNEYYAVEEVAKNFVENVGSDTSASAKELFYDNVVYYYDNLVRHLGWTNHGKVLCGGVWTSATLRVIRSL